MRINSEIDNTILLDKDIEETERKMLGYKESIRQLRKHLAGLYRDKDKLLFGEYMMKSSVREVLSNMNKGESLVFEKKQSYICPYIKRVSGKKFKTKKEGNFTRVFCI